MFHSSTDDSPPKTDHFIKQESPTPFDAGLPGFILLSWVTGQAVRAHFVALSSPVRARRYWPEPESAHA